MRFTPPTASTDIGGRADDWLVRSVGLAETNAMRGALAFAAGEAWRTRNKLRTKSM